MSYFKYLCHFQAENGEDLFARCDSVNPTIGSLVDAYPTYEDLVNAHNATTATISKVNIVSVILKLDFNSDEIRYSSYRPYQKQSARFIA